MAEELDYDQFLKRTVTRLAYMAKPYELFHEEDGNGGSKVILVAKAVRGSFTASATIQPSRNSRVAINNVVSNALKEAKAEIRASIASGYSDVDERRMRLWIANTYDFDNVFYSPDIPKKYREAFEKIDEKERQRIIQRQMRAESLRQMREQGLKKAAKYLTENNHPSELTEEEPVLKIATRQVVPERRKPKVFLCPVHETAMEYDQVTGMFSCKKPRKGNTALRCNISAQPKQSRRENELTLGEGRITVQIHVPQDPGAKPRFILVAANNVALDVTDMPEFSVNSAYVIGQLVRNMERDGVTNKTFLLSDEQTSYVDGTIRAEFSFRPEAVQIIAGPW